MVDLKFLPEVTICFLHNHHESCHVAVKEYLKSFFHFMETKTRIQKMPYKSSIADILRILVIKDSNWRNHFVYCCHYH